MLRRTMRVENVVLEPVTTPVVAWTGYEFRIQMTCNQTYRTCSEMVTSTYCDQYNKT